MSARRDGLLARDAAVLVLAVLATFALPILVYGYLSWRQFDFFRLTYFVPFEAMRAELAAPTVAKLYALPLIQMNMTSGHLLSNMYTLTLGQLALSLALGGMIGLVLVAHLRLRGACSARGSGAAASAGAGLLATVAASSTGLLGCCGSALAGGVLALAGLSSTTAAQVAGASPLLQLALIGLFAWQLVRLRRRREALAGDGLVGGVVPEPDRSY